MAEAIEFGFGKIDRPLRRDGALGDHDDRCVAATAVAAPDPLADLVDVEGLLRNQRDRGTARQARPGGDVPDVSAHHLDDHDPVV